MSDAPDGDEKANRHHIRVGLPGGAVHHLDLAEDAQLSEVVQQVLQAEQLDPTVVRVRLISAGRLYADHTKLVKDVVHDGGFLHCAVSDIVPPEDEPSEPTHERDREHDNVPLVLEAFNVDGEVRIVIPDLPSRGAYDRLAQAGLSPDEIRMVRRHFRLLRREARLRQELAQAEEAENGAGEDGVATDEVRAGRAVRRDEAHNFVFSSGGEGTNGDFLLGCIFGYLLGIIVLVLLLDTNATRRWRVGIIAGVATNCAFGILRTSLYLQSSTLHAP